MWRALVSDFTAAAFKIRWPQSAITTVMSAETFDRLFDHRVGAARPRQWVIEYRREFVCAASQRMSLPCPTLPLRARPLSIPDPAFGLFRFPPFRDDRYSLGD
jgi:hypothetical protein